MGSRGASGANCSNTKSLDAFSRPKCADCDLYKKKERAISPELLKTSVILSGTLKAAAASFEWKTSDWIIQEIGLAIGKNLNIILLIETGVRKPGGLQGDIEHIPFDRDAPSESFGKILKMIKAL